MNHPLTPLEPPYEAQTKAVLEQYPHQNGYLLALFRTFANSERFLRIGVPNLLGRDSPLDLRTREIAILRITANRGCAYEWGVHVAIFAPAARLTEAQVRATRHDDPEVWSDRELRLITAIDQMCETATLTDSTRQSFQDDWTAAQQLELMALCGTYTTISLVANIANLPNEDFAPDFPEASAEAGI